MPSTTIERLALAVAALAMCGSLAPWCMLAIAATNVRFRAGAEPLDLVQVVLTVGGPFVAVGAGLLAVILGTMAWRAGRADDRVSIAGGIGAAMGAMAVLGGLAEFALATLIVF